MDIFVSCSHTCFYVPVVVQHPVISTADTSACQPAFVPITFQLGEYAERQFLASDVELCAVQISPQEKAVILLASPVFVFRLQQPVAVDIFFAPLPGSQASGEFDGVLVSYGILAILCSMAFTVAAASVSKEQAPKAVSKVFVGVSAGMVLGVPVTSFIASEVSFSMAMLFFTVANALVFVATILFIPSMPVKEKVSYGAQLSVLKKTTMWYSIIAVTLINGAMFGFFSYMSDYLKKVTEVSYNVISAVLLVYGLANIVGNVMAGKLLSINARRSIILMPFALLVSYICLFIVGEWIGAMVIVILILGVLAGIASNNMQYMITDAAPEAPDFANGMFLTSANLGTTIGTGICGTFITEMGTRYSVFGSLLFLIASIVFVYLRVRVAHIRKQVNINIVTE